MIRRPPRSTLFPYTTLFRSLFGGGRVPKDDARVAAYGDVDELNAAIGLARALDPRDFADTLLQTIQRDPFTIGAELATPDPDKLHKALARSGAAIGPSDVAALEDAIDERSEDERRVGKECRSRWSPYH